jgi:hypothetical protein
MAVHARLDEGQGRPCSGITIGDIAFQVIDRPDFGVIPGVAGEHAEHGHGGIGFVDAPFHAALLQQIEDRLRSGEQEVVAMVVLEDGHAEPVVLDVAGE